MADQLILAIDQGTSSTKCLLVDMLGRIVSRAAVRVGVSYPAPGSVEQSADEIWDSVVTAVAGCLDGHDPGSVAAVGLSTQRESILLWERSTGRPLGPMLGWQDQRAAAECDRLREAGAAGLVRKISGLPLDSMFSAAKARWLLDRYDAGRARSQAGEICLGTVDSWLMWRLTGDHRIEVGNASRTQLFDVHEQVWSEQLLDLFGVPTEVLPTVVASSASLAPVQGIPGLAGTPVAGVLADSHAALFAHGARRPGLVKASFGTGTSVMGIVGAPEHVADGLCLTIAWQDGTPTYAAEGNIRASGGAIVWAATLLGTTPEGVLELAVEADSDGVDVVPAFGGLAAPWWDDQAVGLVTGVTLGTGRAQLARAVVEAVALQVADVVTTIESAGAPIEVLYVDGGASSSDFLMQLQSDLGQVPVHRARAVDLSALGAAHLAGLGAGLWSESDVADLARAVDVFQPRLAAPDAAARRARWDRAVERARHRPGRLESSTTDVAALTQLSNNPVTIAGMSLT